jgi:hypothetical protein
VTPFQVLTIAVLGLILAIEVVRGRRRGDLGWVRLLRCLVWLLAALAIAFPGLVQGVATLLGVGRGADVVLYVFVLAFLATSFALYTRIRRQQQEITRLVRHLAIEGARRGSQEPHQLSPSGPGLQPTPAEQRADTQPGAPRAEGC